MVLVDKVADSKKYSLGLILLIVLVFGLAGWWWLQTPVDEAMTAHPRESLTASANAASASASASASAPAIAIAIASAPLISPVAMSASAPSVAASLDLLSLFYGFCPRPDETPAQLTREARQAWHRAFQLLDRYDLQGAEKVVREAMDQTNTETTQGAAQREFLSRALRRIQTERDIEGADATYDERGVVVHYPGQLERSDAAWIASEVVRALEEAAQLTGTVRRDRLQVVVASDRSELLATTCMPTWTGGAYDGVLRLIRQPNGTKPVRLAVLRHEALHAQLGASAGRIPSWFNEGVAQYFSGERITMHRRELSLLVANHTYIPFASLDASFTAIEAARDASLAYFQSEAMIELLVSRFGEEAIADGVSFLMQGGAPSGLWGAVTRGQVLDEHDLLRFVEASLAN